MFLGLLITAGAFEIEGLAGVIWADYPSRVFSLSAHGLTLGLMVGLYALHSRRARIDEAYDLGLEVGERRGRRTGRPVIVRLPVVLPEDLPPGEGRHVAAAPGRQRLN